MTEPSQAELLKLIKKVPLKEGFEQVADAYTLPISITQFWDTFFADDSLFYSQLSHPETEKFGEYSSWFKPTDKKYTSFEGSSVQLQRDMAVDFKMPSNPFASGGTAHKHYMLLNKSETELDIAIRVTQEGFPYAENFELLELWNVRSTESNSQNVAVKASMEIDWIKKPVMVAGIFTKMSTDKVTKQVQFYSEFQRGQVEALLDAQRHNGVVEDFVVGAMPGPVAPTKEEWSTTAYVAAGTISVLAALAGFNWMRRKVSKKQVELRDIDLPLHNNELNHYMLYVD